VWDGKVSHSWEDTRGEGTKNCQSLVAGKLIARMQVKGDCPRKGGGGSRQLGLEEQGDRRNSREVERLVKRKKQQKTQKKKGWEGGQTTKSRSRGGGNIEKRETKAPNIRE